MSTLCSFTIKTINHISCILFHATEHELYKRESQFNYCSIKINSFVNMNTHQYRFIQAIFAFKSQFRSKASDPLNGYERDPIICNTKFNVVQLSIQCPSKHATSMTKFKFYNRLSLHSMQTQRE